MDEKICIKCQRSYPLTEFYKESRVKAGVTARCKSCNKADSRAYYYSKRTEVLKRINDSYCPIKERGKKLKRMYGLSSEEYETMLANQNHSCLICHSTDPHHSSGRFVVDHCHTTNKVRGLLCNRCNVGLGNFKDNVASLRSAIDYLECFNDA